MFFLLERLCTQTIPVLFADVSKAKIEKFHESFTCNLNLFANFDKGIASSNVKHQLGKASIKQVFLRSIGCCFNINQLNFCVNRTLLFNFSCELNLFKLNIQRNLLYFSEVDITDNVCLILEHQSII